jgi:hypothetical protein
VWLTDEGITEGHPANRYRPGMAVSRAGMAAFLSRFADGQTVAIPDD